ncbi:MAG: lysophospholipid acyltransferase family protein [Verrucomicrobiia bacterium]
MEVFHAARLADGPLLVVSNHTSHFDPPFLAGFLPKKLDFMATRGLFAHPVSRWLFTSLDVFPVDRARHDLAAVRAATTRLRQQRRVLMFPEGGIRSGPTSVLGGCSLGDGVASLCAIAPCRVQPVLLIGADQLYDIRLWWRRPRIFLKVGEPLELDPTLNKKEAKAALTGAVEQAWRTMLAEIQQSRNLAPLELPHTAQQRWSQP